MIKENFWTGRSHLGRKERKALRELCKSFTGGTSEADFHARNRSAMQALDFLDRAADSAVLNSKREELFSWKIFLLFRSRQWEKLIQEMEHRFYGTTPSDDRLKFFLARSLWECGRPDDAEQYFEALGEEERQRRQHIIDKFYRSRSLPDATIADRHLQPPFKANSSNAINAIWRWYKTHSVTLSEEQIEYLLEHLQGACDSASQFDGQEIAMSDYTSPSEVDGSGLLFISGFGWSGSGAITAFLAHHHQVHVISQKELLWTQGRTKVPLTSIAHVFADGRFDCDRFQDFLISGLLGLVGRGNKKRQYERVFTRSFVGECLRRDIPLTWVMEQIGNALESMRSATEIRHIIKALSQLAVNSLKYGMPERQYGLLNNAIMAPKISVLNFFPGARIIVVRRQLRDQYAARLFESTRNEAPEQFERAIRGSVERFNRRGLNLTEPERVFPLSFEIFLSNRESRNQLLNWLALEPFGREAEENAKSELSKSRKNIGVADSFKDEKWYGRFTEVYSQLPYNEVFSFKGN